jgi:hypothetical protein
MLANQDANQAKDSSFYVIIFYHISFPGVHFALDKKQPVHDEIAGVSNVSAAHRSSQSTGSGSNHHMIVRVYTHVRTIP